MVFILIVAMHLRMRCGDMPIFPELKWPNGKVRAVEKWFESRSAVVRAKGAKCAVAGGSESGCGCMQRESGGERRNAMWPVWRARGDVGYAVVLCQLRATVYRYEGCELIERNGRVSQVPAIRDGVFHRFTPMSARPAKAPGGRLTRRCPWRFEF